MGGQRGDGGNHVGPVGSLFFSVGMGNLELTAWDFFPKLREGKC